MKSALKRCKLSEFSINFPPPCTNPQSWISFFIIAPTFICHCISFSFLSCKFLISRVGGVKNCWQFPIQFHFFLIIASLHYFFYLLKSFTQKRVRDLHKKTHHRKIEVNLIRFLDKSVDEICHLTLRLRACRSKIVCRLAMTSFIAVCHRVISTNVKSAEMKK